MVHRILISSTLLLLITAQAQEALPHREAQEFTSSSSSRGELLGARSAGGAGAGEASLSQRWDHNFSCIFDSSRSFTYLHIVYVTYFNITSKAPTYCSAQQCLDSCTSDCSCSAVVFDSPTSSCYQYHDYVPVQSIPFIPVRGQDTTTAYIKVQRGYHYNRAAPNLPPPGILLAGLAVAAILLW